MGFNSAFKGLTHVSEQPTSHIFKGEAVPKTSVNNRQHKLHNKPQKNKDLNYSSTEDWNFAASLQLYIFRHPRTCTNWAANSEFPPYLTRRNWLHISSYPIPSIFHTALHFQKLSVLSLLTRGVLGTTHPSVQWISGGQDYVNLTVRYYKSMWAG